MPISSPELSSEWLQPSALVAGAVGGPGLLINAFRNLRADLNEGMRAGEARVNGRIDEGGEGGGEGTQGPADPGAADFASGQDLSEGPAGIGRGLGRREQTRRGQTPLAWWIGA